MFLSKSYINTIVKIIFSSAVLAHLVFQSAVFAQTSNIQILESTPSTVSVGDRVDFDLLLENTGSISWSPISSLYCNSNISAECTGSHAPGDYQYRLYAFKMDSPDPLNDRYEFIFPLSGTVNVGQQIAAQDHFIANLPVGEFDVYPVTTRRSVCQFGTQGCLSNWQAVWDDSPHFALTVIEAVSPPISDATGISFYRGQSSPAQIYMVDVDGTNLRKVSVGSSAETIHSWSPDGSKLLFTRINEIYIADADESGILSNIKNLTANPANDHSAAWTPDGQGVVFSSNRHGNFELYAMDVSDLSDIPSIPIERLTFTPENDMNPVIASDGTVAATQNDSILVVYTESGGAYTPTQIYTSGTVTTPSWSLDAQTISFSAGSQFAGSVNNDLRVYTIDRAGGPAQQISPGFGYGPSYSPDGSKIAYIANHNGAPGPITILYPSSGLVESIGENGNLPKWRPSAPVEPVLWSGNGHRYLPVRTGSAGITWADAKIAAESAGGYLATITSAAENDFVFGLIDSPEYWTNGGAFMGPYLGASDIAIENDWQWVSGEAWGFTNWYPGEPSNHPPGEEHLHFFGIGNRAATWNDTDPATRTVPIVSYIIEFDSDPSSDLIGEYLFSGNAGDSSGNGNDGVLNGPDLTTDRFGNVDSAFLFDGQNDFVKLPITSASLGGEFTLNAWIYRTKSFTGNGKMAVISSDRFSQPRGLFMGIYAGDFAGIATYQPGGVGITGPVIPVSQWSMLTMTYKAGSTMQLYIDGQFDQSISVSTPVIGPELHIGWDTYNGSNVRFFGGKIDDVRVYGSALSASEIQELFVEQPGTSNSPPVISGPTTIEVDQFGDASGEFFISDPDGDELTVNVLNLPPEADFSEVINGTYLFTWVDIQTAGETQISIAASDSQGLFGTFDFSVEVIANQPPEIVPLQSVPPIIEILEGEFLELAFSITDPDGFVSFVSEASFPPGAELNMSSDGGVYLFQWAPSFAQGPASYAVAFEATDDDGAIALYEFGIHLDDVESSQVLDIAQTSISFLDVAQVDSPGHISALSSFLNNADAKLLSGDFENAVKEIEKAIERTDGCALRNQVDAYSGKGGDWIIDCAAQETIYADLNLAIKAIYADYGISYWSMWYGDEMDWRDASQNITEDDNNIPQSEYQWKFGEPLVDSEGATLRIRTRSSEFWEPNRQNQKHGDRSKVVSKVAFGPGRYTWQILVPPMTVNEETDQISIGAFLRAGDDSKELDFEIGPGPTWLREQERLKDDEVFAYMTTQDLSDGITFMKKGNFPYPSHIGCEGEPVDPNEFDRCAVLTVIQTGKWYDFTIEIVETGINSSEISWYIGKKGDKNPKKQASQLVRYAADHNIFGSVENLNFIGDRPPNVGYEVLFDTVRFERE